jgi:ubiquinone/menaquinone biosynthesis C-methylase UbiE
MIILANKQAINWILSGWLLSLLLLGPLTANAQKESQFTVISLMNSKPDLEAGITFYRSLYDVKNGEKIASVGAGRGSREVIYSMLADSLTMYIQEIDTASLKSDWIMQLAIRQYNLAELPITASFRLIAGTASDTRLPTATLDKVLLEHSLHEFTQQTQMLTDIRTKLKPDGLLYVWELMAKKPGRQHRICKKQMLTEQELLELTNKTGFRLIKSVRVFSDVRNGRLYTFTLANQP